MMSSRLIRWMSGVATALSMLAAAPAECAVTVILTRHAEKAESASADPPLSAAGKRRAELLATMLAPAGVSAIYATDARRTQETAQPLARLTRLPVTRIEVDRPAELVQAIRQRQSGVVVVVGHSDTVPAIISALGGPAVRIEEGDYDNLFVMALSEHEPSIVRLHYRPNQAAGALSKNSASAAERRAHVMKIKFVRSGGLAGMPGLNVEGTVDLGDPEAKVTSDGAKYQRNLTEPEAQQLRTAVDPAAMSRAKSAVSSGSAARDAYQYDIAVTTSDGKTQNVTLNAAGGQDLGKAAPGLGQLVQWIDQEAQRIKEHRLGNR